MNHRSRTLSALAAAGLAVACLGASPALASSGHTVSLTTTQHGTWTESGDTDFCTNEAISPTITGNSVMHVTYFPAGDEVWGTFTTEGTGSYVQPSTGLVYSGRVTVWGNFNVNEQNQNQTFTATFDLTAVDSSGTVHTEVGHIVEHVAYNAADPTSPIVSFGNFTGTCS
ncbi:hypothetical protein SA2016_0930 [Sinomonas atrocyanea]|uniref:Uncharacterized protein n=1 Tax=Sinomonas atrocyanea TaxID=37927 RepID=A0A126ZXK5_9MICC|nr:hypothetical protein [Sinomonas atrocyanea]AMM31616.1 hypothetical protein SA2016_0930 [Sinomonas atrocyanea]GEB64242.1 hypothetical protein SAT01_16900 [Sinomonas atrocyanea]GGG57556.1 hypothetical protein GCM10007172_05510 [Sinomonas atrocyanea]